MRLGFRYSTRNIAGIRDGFCEIRGSVVDFCPGIFNTDIKAGESAAKRLCRGERYIADLQAHVPREIFEVILGEIGR